MNDYQPLSPKELERGYFFQTHKEGFKKISLFTFIAVIVVIYGVAIFSLISTVRGAGFNETAQRLVGGVFDWQTYHQNRAPLPVIASSSQFISLGDLRYDLVAFINNPNNDWAMPEFEYTFLVNGVELPTQTSFLNPGENRMLIRTAYVASGTIKEVKVNIGTMKWRRYEKDVPVVDWDIQNVRYQPITRQTVDKKSFIISPRVIWEAKNMSLYDFWTVDWQVALFSGDKVVGIKEYRAKDFNSLQSKEMEVVWLNDLPRVTKTVVYPVLNWLDSKNFKTMQVENLGNFRR